MYFCDFKVLPTQSVVNVLIILRPHSEYVQCSDSSMKHTFSEEIIIVKELGWTSWKETYNLFEQLWTKTQWIWNQMQLRGLSNYLTSWSTRFFVQLVQRVDYYQIRLLFLHLDMTVYDQCYQIWTWYKYMSSCDKEIYSIVVLCCGYKIALIFRRCRISLNIGKNTANSQNRFVTQEGPFEMKCYVSLINYIMNIPDVCRTYTKPLKSLEQIYIKTV